MTKPKNPSKSSDKKIVIEGVTPAGDAFRPSDWAERMSGALASFKNSRIHYSPLLQPSVNHEGYKCVLLDPKLKESSPLIYQSILEFAKANQLKICDENETPDSDD
ncbi:MAG: DUF3579 domain-containing protein [Legionellaceae bacterium]|nr:DUF3579 domain-containing protein [Legionellaceae bacterium]